MGCVDWSGFLSHFFPKLHVPFPLPLGFVHRLSKAILCAARPCCCRLLPTSTPFRCARTKTHSFVSYAACMCSSSSRKIVPKHCCLSYNLYQFSRGLHVLLKYPYHVHMYIDRHLVRCAARTPLLGFLADSLFCVVATWHCLLIMQSLGPDGAQNLGPDIIGALPAGNQKSALFKIFSTG